ncbi:F-box protein At1g11270-like [Salvia splendens]|uniref:F-box protein At1g11270-like n=1 Tax=Salvia splendens TaxID=180675 RepID=UPI001C270F08|nr:F-box protein At1g11270-like [Salvia splendens]
MNGFNLFGELPLEIAIDILSRLPIGTIVWSKLVSKAWRDAIKSHEFVEAHLSKREHKHEHDTFFVKTSFGGSEAYKLLEGYGSSTPTTTTICRTDTLAEYKPLLPYSSSVMGLMLLLGHRSDVFSICNPVTREYVRVPLPPPPNIIDHLFHMHLPKFHRCISYGIGVSKKSKQYKLVYIFGCHGCHVYTLGTGQWRVGPSPPITEGYFTGGGNWASLDGKLYWVKDMENICSFDLESEVFTSFSAPCCPNTVVGIPVEKVYFLRRVCVLEEGLCVCDTANSSTYGLDMLIWIMRKEGVWRLLCRIHKKIRGNMHMTLPIKVLGKGKTILMASIEGCGKRYWYDTNNGSTTQIGSLNQQYTYACPFSPTFVSLKTLFQHQDKDIIHSF